MEIRNANRQWQALTDRHGKRNANRQRQTLTTDKQTNKGRNEQTE
jgi:hypothetical protein